MHKRQKLIATILKITPGIVGIFLLGILVNSYSKHTGLFDNFDVKINGN